MLETSLANQILSKVFKKPSSLFSVQVHSIRAPVIKGAPVTTEATAIPGASAEVFCRSAEGSYFCFCADADQVQKLLLRSCFVGTLGRGGTGDPLGCANDKETQNWA